MKNSILILLFVVVLTSGFSNTTTNISKTLDWQESPIIHNPTGNFPIQIWAFEGASYSDMHPSLPLFSENLNVSSNGKVTARLINAEYERFDKQASEDDIYLSSNIKINTKVYNARGKYFINYSLIPIRKTSSGAFERLTSFEIVLDFEEIQIARPRTNYTYNSELGTGDIYKIGITETGMHKISYDFLKNELEIDIDNINPDKIRILGNGGGILPETVDDPRYDDLEEVAIQVVGDEDDSFNSSDYILFYAEGPDKWYFDDNAEYFHRPKNFYSDVNYYFIKIDSENGLRVGSQASLPSTDYSTSEYDSYVRLEEDRFNLLNEALGVQGSGRHWYGDPFNPTRERTYDFDFPNINTSDPISMRVLFAGRTKTATNYFVEVEGEQYSRSISSITWTNNESTYARAGLIDRTFLPSGNTTQVTVKFPSVGDGTNLGWLDYIELNSRSSINKIDDQLLFRDHETMTHSSSTFQVANVTGTTKVWDITDPLKPNLQDHSLSGSNLSFGVETEGLLKEFIAFEPNGSYPEPTDAGKIENQNIHAFDDIDLAIIYHKDFEDAALELAEHRRDFSGYNVAAVEIEQVFNEFACGRKDMSAVRDFAKMLYDRSPDKFNYLLLFGDGSYDFKDITTQGKNFVPPFETKESLNPIRGFPSDDYFGLLTEGEGSDLIGALDIGVGRLPCRTVTEANTVTQKIIKYDSGPSTLGDWRNRVTFNADDEDSKTHMNQADDIGERLRANHKVFNLNKIYFDAYQQVSTSGGARFPKANEAINRDMFKGVLVMNYLGHGGSKGWAQERVLTNDDIGNWTNTDKLPLFVTATCSFTGYDEPSITTAGEQAMLLENGGVIGLFTTTRAVYSSANKRLTDAVFDTIFQDLGKETIPIGEILRLAKNANRADTLETNSRKFTLIGDPSMKLAIPKYQIATTKINDIEVSSGLIDTIRALQQVTVEGVITDSDGNMMTDFNGTVQPTIYDKVVNAVTLGQDAGSRPVKSFKLQQNIIFKGNASVINGQFSFSFVVPKDINYEYGFGRISYYADDGVSRDARGYFENFVIGGTNPDAIADDQGPLVEVFMNNEDFAIGGITSPNPTLIVKLSDDNGINVVGNSIGHDLTGVIDEQTQDTYILNDFYESELDDYTKGQVKFPLFNLEEGLHRIKIKAWDIANNSGEGYTEFVVASDEEIALDYVLNYPNPFTTCTNFQFEHNIKDQGLEVQIQIFTVSGKMVKTIEEQLFTDGGRVYGIKWDGTDDYGGRLAKGVYLYKIKVRSDDLKTSESEFEKLVILK